MSILNFFHDNFFEIKLTLAGATSFDVRTDDLIFAPMVRVAGSWYAALAGDTPSRAGLERTNTGDTFTFTDALAVSESILQYWLWRDYGISLPSAISPGETIADP